MRTSIQAKAPALTARRKPARTISNASAQPGDVLDLETQMANSSRFGHDLSRIPIQPKLTVGPAGDQYEEEADKAAAQVVKQVNRPPAQASGLAESAQRKGSTKKDKKLEPVPAFLQRKPSVQHSAEENRPVMPALEASIQTAHSSGQTLPKEVLSDMGQAFEADFSQVKVHTNSKANELSRSLHARAFTTGQDIFFGQGEYNPSTHEGQELLAHELTHVIHQNGTGVRNANTFQRKCREGHSGPLEEKMYVCTRSAFFQGSPATHKYMFFSDGSFCGMGSAQSEKGPAGDTCKEYWMPKEKMQEVKKVCQANKEAADDKLWKPVINDCHKVVEDTLKVTGHEPAKELGRFGKK